MPPRSSTDYPRTKVDLRFYLADRLRDHEPGLTLDDIVDAFWPLYFGLLGKVELPQGDDE